MIDDDEGYHDRIMMIRGNTVDWNFYIAVMGCNICHIVNSAFNCCI